MLTLADATDGKPTQHRGPCLDGLPIAQNPMCDGAAGVRGATPAAGGAFHEELWYDNGRPLGTLTLRTPHIMPLALANRLAGVGEGQHPECCPRSGQVPLQTGCLDGRAFRRV